MQSHNYISALNQLTDKFKNGTLDSFNFQKQVFDIYKHEDRTDEVKDNFFNYIENIIVSEHATKNKDSYLPNNWMWPVFFGSDQEMWGRLHILETRLLAEDCLEDYISCDKNQTLLEQICTTAYLTIKNMRDETFTLPFINPVRNEWLKVFKEHPNFKTSLTSEEKHWENVDIQYKSKDVDYSDRIKVLSERPIVATYIFAVPAKIKSDNLDIFLNTQLYKLADSIVEDFNSFQLEGYLDEIGTDCVNSSVQFNNMSFTFKFNYARELNKSEINTLKEELAGQLSDGWGESIEQQSILIDNEDVAIGFEYNHITLVASDAQNTITPTIET